MSRLVQTQYRPPDNRRSEGVLRETPSIWGIEQGFRAGSIWPVLTRSGHRNSARGEAPAGAVFVLHRQLPTGCLSMNRSIESTLMRNVLRPSRTASRCPSAM